MDPPGDDVGRATDARGDMERRNRAIGRAGAALHASIEVSDPSLPIGHLKNTMGTYGFARPAPNALFRLKR